MEESALEQDKYLRGRYRVGQLRNYYMHLLVYVLVNLFISGVKITFAMRAGERFGEAALSYNSLSVWVIWGIILFIHSFRVLVLPYILGSDWEYRKLQAFLDEELSEKTNFKS
jgi:hypothetical protein